MTQPKETRLKGTKRTTKSDLEKELKNALDRCRKERDESRKERDDVAGIVASLQTKKSEIEEELKAAEQSRQAAELRHKTLSEDKQEKLQQAQDDAELLRNVLMDRLSEDEDDKDENNKKERFLRELYAKKNFKKEDFPETVEACHQKMTEMRVEFAKDTLKLSRKTEALRRARQLLHRLCKMVPAWNQPVGWQAYALPLLIGGLGILGMFASMARTA